MKNFDDLLAKDRTFQIGGEQFQWRDVRPETLTAFEPSRNGKDELAVWSLMDEQIMLFIAPSDHDKWRTLRAREDKPVTIRQLTAVLDWLMEQQTGRPTVTPSPSDPGRGRTAASSKAG